MEKIKVLDPSTIDQIAAGEVVERPAHMVKELIENSLDAGADSIEVEYSSGGRFVRVKDNGRGISKDEIPLALQRFATSKITESSDLWKLSSFGFRGEALASISAVSDLSLRSKTDSQDMAYELSCRFGDFDKNAKPSGVSEGTEISVSNLFENVPARLKFLKSDGAEGSQIKKIVRLQAAIHPGVSFQLKQSGKLVFHFEKSDSALKRVEEIFEVSPMYEVSGEYEKFEANVYFSSPEKTTRTSQSIWIFVQGRAVQDRGLQAAVMDAYRSLLMHGEFPNVIVDLKCDPEEVDVNIHPTKSQVKFRDRTHAFRAVNRTLRSALESAPWVENVTGRGTGSPNLNDTTIRMRPSVEVNEELSAPEFTQTSFKKKAVYAPETVSDLASQVFKPSIHESLDDLRVEPSWSKLDVIGQVNLTYIVTQSRKSMVLLDQHAAHERVAYERLMKAFRGGDIEVQNHLIPLTIDLSPEYAEALLSQKDEILKLGIALEAIGPDSVAINSAPALIREKGLMQGLSKMAEEIFEKGDSFAVEKSMSDVCATLACHSVVRAGQSLSLEEMKSLMVQMDEFPLSSFCPHGRPVFVELPFDKLDRDFGRIV